MISLYSGSWVVLFKCKTYFMGRHGNALFFFFLRCPTDNSGRCPLPVKGSELKTELEQTPGDRKTAKPGVLQSMESERVRYDLVTN